MKKKNKSLVTHIVLVLGLVILGMFVIQNYLSIKNVQKSTAKDYKDACAAIVHAYATNLQSRNSNFMQQIRIYTQDDNLKNGNHDQVVEWINSREKARSKDFVYAAYIDADGMAFADSGATKNVQSEYFCKSMLVEKKSQLYGDPIKNPFGSDWVIPLTKSYNKDSVTGFISVGLPLSNLQNQIPSITLNGKGYAFILSGNGTVMAHPAESLVMNANLTDSDEKGYTGISTVAKQMITGETGAGWFTEPDGTKQFVSYAPIKGTAWSLGFAVTQNLINSTANELRRTIAIQAALIILVLLVTAAFLIHNSLKPLKKVDSAIQEIASGNADLTQRIKVKSNDEIGSVTNGFNNFMNKLHAIMSNIKSSRNILETAGQNLENGTTEAASSITEIIANITSVTNQVTHQSSSVEETASAVAQIAQNISSLEKMIENQSAGVVLVAVPAAEIIRAVEEMIGNISSVNDSVEKMAASFHELEQKAAQGAQKQEDVNTRIEQIESQSDMLQEANTAIANIAAQTNLLAMNAAIEAAHAGEAGKGFSVVADEIRKLSETSTTQSKTIGDQLNKIKDSIGAVVSASSESSATFSNVAESIQETDSVVQQIKAAMTEQQEGSRQISEALHSMNDSTSEVRNASKKMSAGNQAILKEVKNLQDVSLNIKNSMDEMSIGAGKINETSSSLFAITGEMKDAITQIGDDINQFHT